MGGRASTLVRPLRTLRKGHEKPDYASVEHRESEAYLSRRAYPIPTEWRATRKKVTFRMSCRVPGAAGIGNDKTRFAPLTFTCTKRRRPVEALAPTGKLTNYPPVSNHAPGRNPLTTKDRRHKNRKIAGMQRVPVCVASPAVTILARSQTPLFPTTCLPNMGGRLATTCDNPIGKEYPRLPHQTNARGADRSAHAWGSSFFRHQTVVEEFVFSSPCQGSSFLRIRFCGPAPWKSSFFIRPTAALVT